MLEKGNLYDLTGNSYNYWFAEIPNLMYIRDERLKTWKRDSGIEVKNWHVFLRATTRGLSRIRIPVESTEYKCRKLQNWSNELVWKSLDEGEHNKTVQGFIDEAVRIASNPDYEPIIPSSGTPADKDKVTGLIEMLRKLNPERV
ncbi:hypothetical protein ACFLZB_00455 [Nanoarchaeota archaeon]